MNATQSALDRWAAESEMACTECEQAELILLDHGEQEALEHVRRARETTWNTYRSLLDAGAQPVEGFGVPAPIPLRLLDTPASRRLMGMLRAVVEAAEMVDAERGRTLPPGAELQPGESRGTDLAESLSELLLRVRLEVEGPKGRE